MVLFFYLLNRRFSTKIQFPALVLKMILNSMEIIIGLYLLFLVFAIYILFIKQQSIPQCIKRIRVFIVLILIAVPAIFLVNYSSSHTIPDLQIKLINNGSNEIHISNHGEFFLSVSRTPGSNTVLHSGKIKMKTSDNNYLNEFIILPKGELIVYGQIINPAQYLVLFERENFDMQLILYQANGRMLYQEGIPFDRDTFSNYCIPFEI